MTWVDVKAMTSLRDWQKHTIIYNPFTPSELFTKRLFLNYFFWTRTPRISLIYTEKPFKNMLFSVLSAKSVYHLNFSGTRNTVPKV
jgi:hypothetical protein